MIEKVKCFMEKEQMLKNTDSLVVGVSGGADSVCLLLLLHALKPVFGYHLTAVHVNHGIRGQEAAADQQYVEQLCEQYGVPLEVFEYDIPAMAEKLSMTEEEAGRMVRYQSFAKQAAKEDRGAIAVAHHMEDQAETILFRMARGTGITGLRGMLPVSTFQDTPVIRPLLCVHRKEIEDYLQGEQVGYCQDATNGLLDYRRNYIRHRIIPELLKVNDQAVEHIMQLSKQAAQVEAFIREEADHVWMELVKKKQETGKYQEVWQIPCARFQVLPDVMQQEVMRRLIKEAAGSLKDVTRQHVEMALECVNGCMKKVNLPGQVEVFRSYDYLLAARKKNSSCESGKCQTGQAETNLRDLFCFCEYSYDSRQKINKKNYTKTIDCARIEGMLSVRYRQPGDFIVLDDNGHRKSLKKFFIDEKIPQYMRDFIPLVCDGNQVVWIVGYRLSAAYYVNETTVSAMDMIYLGQND